MCICTSVGMKTDRSPCSGMLATVIFVYTLLRACDDGDRDSVERLLLSLLQVKNIYMYMWWSERQANASINRLKSVCGGTNPFRNSFMCISVVKKFHVIENYLNFFMSYAKYRTY